MCVLGTRAVKKMEEKYPRCFHINKMMSLSMEKYSVLLTSYNLVGVTRVSNTYNQSQENQTNLLIFTCFGFTLCQLQFNFLFHKLNIICWLGC